MYLAVFEVRDSYATTSSHSCRKVSDRDARQARQKENIALFVVPLTPLAEVYAIQMHTLTLRILQLINLTNIPCTARSDTVGQQLYTTVCTQRQSHPNDQRSSSSPTRSPSRRRF